MAGTGPDEGGGGAAAGSPARVFDTLSRLQLGLLGGALDGGASDQDSATGARSSGDVALTEPLLVPAVAAAAHFAQRPWWHSLLIVALALAVVDVALYLSATRNRVRVTTAREVSR